MGHLEKLELYQNMINELRPFEGEMLKQIKSFYRVGLTWTSNALEGNSLTESETKVLIEDGLTVGGRPLRDMFEAVDHAKAYDYMFTLLGNKEITEKHILYLHKLCYQNISLLEKAHEDDSLFISFISERELESQKDFLRLLHIPLPKLKQDNGEMKME